MNPALIPIIGKVIDTVSNIFKDKHKIDEENMQNEKLKERNRHESDMNKDELIKINSENSQRNLEKAQLNEDKAKNQENKAKESELKVNKEVYQNLEIQLREKMDNTEKHFNEIMKCRISQLNEEKYILNSIYDEKDKAFNRVLSIMNEIVDDGIDAFNSHLESRGIIEEITECKMIVLERNNKISDELVVIKSDISRLKNNLTTEEAKYDQLIELKYSLNNNDYKKKFVRVSYMLLDVANKTNDTEISLVKTENEKTNSDEKLKIIERQFQAIKRKEFKELFLIFNSLNTQKKMLNMPYSKTIQSEINDKELYQNNDIIDVQLQNDSIKGLEN